MLHRYIWSFHQTEKEKRSAFIFYLKHFAIKALCTSCMSWIVTWLLSVQAGQSRGWIHYAIVVSITNNTHLMSRTFSKQQKKAHLSEPTPVSLGMLHFRKSLTLRKCRRRCIGVRINGQRTFQDSAQHKGHKCSFPAKTITVILFF